MLLLALSWASFQAGFVGLLYLAIEPFVKRNWPDSLISWMRAVNGRFRDPLVTSHILARRFRAFGSKTPCGRSQTRLAGKDGQHPLF